MDMKFTDYMQCDGNTLDENGDPLVCKEMEAR
jgi:hypothetical protein